MVIGIDAVTRKELCLLRISELHDDLACRHDPSNDFLDQDASGRWVSVREEQIEDILADLTAEELELQSLQERP